MTRILLIDNYDSFTYNLVHYLSELGAEVEVIRNDVMRASDILGKHPAGIVLSPGPATPNEAGVCLELIAEAATRRIPVFGVCLGHQAIGQAFGGKVIRAPKLMHGKTSPIYHHGHTMFAGIPSPFIATRYHSLIVERATLPACLTITATTEDGLIMGLAHKELPVYGVQFHPESIASEYGHQILKNFLTCL